MLIYDDLLARGLSHHSDDRVHMGSHVSPLSSRPVATAELNDSFESRNAVEMSVPKAVQSRLDRRVTAIGNDCTDNLPRVINHYC
jgi:hypothetical protein